MHGLLFNAMSDLTVEAEPGSPPKPKGRRSSVVALDDVDSGPGYMDIPDEFITGSTARASIDLSAENGSDYLCVVVPPDFNSAGLTIEEGGAAAPVSDFE